MKKHQKKADKNGSTATATTTAPLTGHVRRGGNTLLIPKNMATGVALQLVTRHHEAQEKDTCIRETIPISPLEGAIALHRILNERYDLDIEPDRGTTMSLEIAPGHTILVPIGQYDLPDMEGGYISTEVDDDDSGHLVTKLHAHVKGKFEAQLRGIIEEVRKTALKQSPFRGKAFSLQLRDEDGDPIDMPKPKFMVLPNHVVQLIFRTSLENSLQTNIFGLIENTAIARKHGIPLRRGVLLAGVYGTGKSLTATYLAQLCIQNGWTFIEVKDPEDLIETLDHAKQYSPCVVFVEDIDRITGLDRGKDEVNDVINALDGAGTKNDEIMVVMTSNHPEKINPAMRRPGRIDVAINMETPDAEAAARLIELYAAGRLESGVDLAGAGAMLEGEIPATIREVVERAKLHSIAYNNGDKITDEGLRFATESFKSERNLFNVAAQEPRDAMNVFGTAIGREIGDALKHSRNGNGVHAPVTGV